MNERDAEVRIGRYQLVERLGAGGMGVVYKALADGPEGVARPVVIKRVLPAYSSDPGFVDMLVSEARLGALLKHPAIVQIFELGRSRGEYYLAMEYIDGFNLTSVLKAAARQGKPVPAGVAVHLVSEVLSALAHAHAICDEEGKPLELVHRDVSPSNIMVTQTGTVKLVDFGIAKAVNHADVTTSGHVKGKLGYLAPEQVRRQRLDRRTDIYALGIVFHELLTMQRLFGGHDYIDAMQRLMEASVPPPSTLCAAVPTELDDIVLKMLARDPADRFTSCDDVLAALGPVRAAVGGDGAELRAYLQALAPIETRPEATASMPSPPSPATTITPAAATVSARRRRRAPRRVRLAWALGALLLIAAGAGTGMTLARRAPCAHEPTPPPIAPTAAVAAAPPPAAGQRPALSLPPTAPELPTTGRAHRPRQNRVVTLERPTPLGPTFQEDDIKDPFTR